MKHVEYRPTGVCTRMISFDLDENNVIHNTAFFGGCNGNLKAISKLIEGRQAKDVVTLLEGNTCGPRNTSCADQLTKAIVEAINSIEQ